MSCPHQTISPSNGFIPFGGSEVYNLPSFYSDRLTDLAF